MDPVFVPTHPRIRELERLGDEIAELSAHLDAATARLLTLLREFDARGGWDGARSCAEWLSWRVGLDLGAARERVRVARALGGLPLLSAALARGELSYSKVRALTRVATPETEARLLAVGRAGTAAHVEKIVRGWRRVDRQVEAQEARARHQGRSLQVYTDEDGMVVVRGRLEPEAGAVLVRALEAARETLYAECRTVEAAAAGPDSDPPTAGQQRADALALVAETALEHGLGADPRSERYQVVVHVDATVLADPARPGQSVLEDGERVSAETSRRLACEATRVEMRHAANGQGLDVGRRTRAIPPALRRALEARDRGCRFPGCGVRHAQGHHIHHWANGGPTRLSNLTSLCRVHHRAVHEEGYTVVRDADGTLHFSTPRGRPIPEVPTAPAVPRDAAHALVATNLALGLRIDARTGLPSWCGDRLDLGWAIDVLHPAANPAAYRSVGG
jgi:hypothetical protein